MENTNEPLRILVLDGGDLRVLSQMIILDEVMSRVAWDRKENVLPCDYFHSIAGVGAGGLLAVLLGVLGMTPIEALEIFIDIYKKILTPDIDLTPVSRSSALEASLKSLLEKRGMFEGQTLVGTGRCCTFVCAVSASDSTSCCKFRNYKHRGALSNITIINAVRASWASPGLFTSVLDGPSSFKEEFIGGDCAFANPTREAIKEAYDHFGPRRRVGHIISIGCGFSRGIGSSADQYFSDPQRVAIDLNGQLGESGVYHRYGISTFEESTYTLSMDAVDRIVGKTKIYLRSIDKALDECIIDLSEDVYLTTGSLYQTQNTPLITATDLPPLSTYFVTRKDVMEAMDTAFFGLDEAGRRVMVVIGMGGSGKTQGVAKFMRVHKDKFSAIFFIDASSIETIESSLVQKIRPLARQTPVKTLSNAFSVLCQPEGKLGRHWAIIYDGADDPNLDISRVIPRCDHGTVIITSRNQNLQTISPLACIKLDAMYKGDAIALLLKTALPHVQYPSINERKLARAIVEELGCLAIAVSQAGCHIQMQNGIEQYLDRLKSNRSTVLRRPMGTQLEEGHRSVYAALDVTFPVLSTHTVDVLSTLSFLHPAAFPLEVIIRAARGQFSIQPAELLPRSSAFLESIHGLCDIFMSSVIWDEEIWALLNELQSYSLVTLMPSGASVVLRFHNLVFAWARDRLSPTENEKYQSFAIRLLVCCTTEEDEDMFDLLFPHIQMLAPLWKTAHVNDQVGFANVIRHSGQSTDLKLIWGNIHEKVTEVHGSDHLQTSEAALYLADACWRNGEEEEASSLESKVVNFRTQSLGRNHPRTIDAIARQALGYYNQDELENAETLQREVLCFRYANPHGDTKGIVHALEDLADTLVLQSRLSEASKSLEQALEASIHKLGKNHWRSKRLMERLQDQSLKDKENDTDMGDLGFEEKLEVALRRSMQEFLETDPTEARWASFVEEHMELQLTQPQHFADIASLALSYYTRAMDPSFSALLRKLAVDMRSKMDGDSATPFPESGFWDELASLDNPVIPREAPLSEKELMDIDDQIMDLMISEQRIELEIPSHLRLSGHTDSIEEIMDTDDQMMDLTRPEQQITAAPLDILMEAPSHQTLSGHTYSIYSVAFSPDGARIVSGSYDKTLRLWDGETGEAIGDPIDGHTNWVHSVSFSPDGTRIISCSSDKNLRLWNSVTGEPIGVPMEGHTGRINNAVFSPDGTRVVSGSHDGTLRLWDGETGTSIGGPLIGHADRVRSVALSPDGTRIVSCSADRTLRLWNSVTGVTIGRPMMGHTSQVKNAAFSPDGTRVVSCSYDNTLRLWDGVTGASIGRPMTGHKSWVENVIFSPDGTRIVSGSSDSTLCLWDGVTGASISGPMNGHTSAVNSVAFSPNGTLVVSGSYDSTLRLWNGVTGASIGGPMNGHSTAVNSVAFSPDGTRIVSGSSDFTVRLWDVMIWCRYWRDHKFTRQPGQ